MEQTNIKLKKGDRIRVQTYDILGNPSRLRTAEFLAVLRIPSYGMNEPYVAVHYLDEGNINYECISSSQVVRVSDEDNANY